MSRLRQTRPTVSVAESVAFPDRFFGSVVLGGGTGWLIDSWLGVFPLFTSLGSTVGMALGFYLLVVLSRPRNTNGR